MPKKGLTTQFVGEVDDLRSFKSFRMDFLMGCLGRLQCGVPTRFIISEIVPDVPGHAVTAVGYDDFKECFIVA